ncbi:MAG TPA: ATPase domain-containing protein [Candidatus Binatia bacterium]|nr:ATPase domain-containing protein [Candidatus Binatia bacterium]
MDLARIPTGIAGLDPLFNGGFIKGRSYLISGDAGTGKTLACLQFLISALGRGEKAVYVTVDERPAEILEAAAAFSWDLQPHIQAKSLAILDAASGSATEKGIDPQKLVADLGTYTKSLAATILIIDPITPLLVPTNPAVPRQAHARSLIQLIQSQLNTTNLFTSHDPGAKEQDPNSRIEQFLASGVLVMKTNETRGRCERAIHVKKMRHTPVEPGVYPFMMAQNEGIVLLDRSDGTELPRHVETQFFQSFEPSKNGA